MASHTLECVRTASLGSSVIARPPKSLFDRACYPLMVPLRSTPAPEAAASPHRPIATMNEGPLHAAIKAWYAQPGDSVEVPFRGRQIDIVRGELLIEIQTRSFASLRSKLESLVATHDVRVVHPVPLEKWIVRVEADKNVGGDGERVLGRRKSPLRGRVEDAFEELVSLRDLLAHPRFSLEILLTREEEVRRHEAGRVRRRKGWMIVERRLLEVADRRVFRGVHDLQALLPDGLPDSFTTADLAASTGLARDLAQKMAYCLRAAGALRDDGKQGNARAYVRAGAVVDVTPSSSLRAD